MVASQQPDLLLAPASVTKVLTAVAALDALGAEHRAVTTLSVTDPLDGGVLTGDLTLHAAGDPTWNERFTEPGTPDALENLARQVASAGVGRVAGDLVVDLHRFPGRGQPVSRPLGELAYGWAAPVSGVALDENSVSLRIAPGPRVGAPGVVDIAASVLAGPVINEIRTVSRARHDKGTFDVLPSWHDGGLVLRGEYPISEPPYVLSASVPDPALRVGRALVAALATHGVKILGDVRTTYRPPDTVDRRVVARHASPPLARWLEPMLRDSHNWYAEMVLRQLAWVRHGEGRLDEGLTLVRRFMEDTVGVPGDAFALDDGSGLSAENLVSARAVTSVLAFADRQAWRGAFRAALATNGRGTLVGWSGLPPVVAKTGTRRHTQTLAGYLEPTAGEPIVFAVLLDHRTQPKAALRREIARLLSAWARDAPRVLPKENRP